MKADNTLTRTRPELAQMLSQGQAHDPLARRLEAIERFGDAIIRWVVTLTLTVCIAAVGAAYVAQYLEGK